MKRAEHATQAEDYKVWRENVTPEEIAYWSHHAATLTQEEILLIIKQSLNDNTEAVQSGDDAAETYHTLKVLTYSEVWTRREFPNLDETTR